jgi:hypothetical protein
MIHLFLVAFVLGLVGIAGARFLELAWPRWPTPADRTAMLRELCATVVLGAACLLGWLLTQLR